MTPILAGAPWLVAHRLMLGINRPYKITLNGQDYVLWQNKQGKVFALENLCPHMQSFLFSIPKQAAVQKHLSSAMANGITHYLKCQDLILLPEMPC